MPLRFCLIPRRIDSYSIASSCVTNTNAFVFGRDTSCGFAECDR